MSGKRFKRIFVWLSIVSFFGPMAYGAIGSVNSALKPPTANTQAAPPSQASQLQAQEKGYETVLKREPDNQVALRGLVEIRLQKKDAKSAIAPLEKLAKLNPNQQEYKVLLAQLKKQVK